MNRERRTLLVGALIVCSIVMIGRVIPAMLGWSRGEEARASELLREALRLQEDLHIYPVVRDSAHARRLRLGDEIPSLLHGATLDETSAALAALIREAGDASGVRVGTIDLRSDTASAHVYSHQRAATDIAGDVHGIASFLSSLESSETRIRVVALSISQNDPFAGPRQAEALQMNIVIEGLARRSVRAAKTLAEEKGI